MTLLIICIIPEYDHAYHLGDRCYGVRPRDDAFPPAGHHRLRHVRSVERHVRGAFLQCVRALLYGFMHVIPLLLRKRIRRVIPYLRCVHCKYL